MLLSCLPRRLPPAPFHTRPPPPLFVVSCSLRHRGGGHGPTEYYGTCGHVVRLVNRHNEDMLAACESNDEERIQECIQSTINQLVSLRFPPRQHANPGTHPLVVRLRHHTTRTPRSWFADSDVWQRCLSVCLSVCLSGWLAGQGAQHRSLWQEGCPSLLHMRVAHAAPCNRSSAASIALPVRVALLACVTQPSICTTASRNVPCQMSVCVRSVFVAPCQDQEPIETTRRGGGR